MKTRCFRRTGSVATLLCLLMLPLLALIAFFVDYGFLLYVRTDLQRSADQAVLAGVRDLLPNAQGEQDFEAVKQRIIEYVHSNLGDDFDINADDIEIGRYNPTSIYTNLEMLTDGTLDTVRVSLRRDNSSNSSVSLYFARLFDRDESNVSVVSAAVMQRARYLGPGTSILPFAVSDELWNSLNDGDEFNIYGDGQVDDGAGNSIPGNWGTVDIGPTNNSTADLREQIRNGLSQSDLDSLHGQGRIPNADFIDSQQMPLSLNADPGFSAGIKSAIQDVHGQTKLIPIYDSGSIPNGGGNNFGYEIIGWGVVEVVDSEWRGSQNSYVNVQKSYLYDGKLIANPDLSDTTNVIDGAFTFPVLVQ